MAGSSLATLSALVGGVVSLGTQVRLLVVALTTVRRVSQQASGLMATAAVISRSARRRRVDTMCRLGFAEHSG